MGVGGVDAQFRGEQRGVDDGAPGQQIGELPDRGVRAGSDLVVPAPTDISQVADEQAAVADRPAAGTREVLDEGGGVTRPVAGQGLGILIETTNRARNRIWRAPEVLAALDAFAERAGLRG